MEYRCVQCGFRIKKLYVQYSPGNIRLMKCENCKAVADEYIECELMILLIDLILHKPKAYRHLLYNVLNQETGECKGLLWKSALGFLALDAYRCLLLEMAREGWDASMSFSSVTWTCVKILVDVFLGNFFLFYLLLLMTRISFTLPVGFSRHKDFTLAILVSSYFKLLLLAMMIWEFPSSVVFIIDLFVLSSNAMALKVITESTTEKCIGACFTAHAAKFFASHLLKWCFA
ncbi:protein ARV 2-like [Syzygium oleosum]|uniref:protein ARV 2-like n=1 Tax=Syzygium oleosum TaxID=219896 RepID=UPI0011D1994F|nr:protein ARV 2-like [Syzygium oleosum]XP_056160076.1 protein ARV 2-like [Syzygium oleosum]